MLLFFLCRFLLLLLFLLASGLPTDLFVLLLLSKPGFHSIILFVHLSCGRDAILIAILHFSLLWVSIQQGIVVFCLGSSASFFLLFSMKSIRVFVFIFLERNITVLVFEHCSELSPVFCSVAQREAFSYCFSIPFVDFSFVSFPFFVL